MLNLTERRITELIKTGILPARTPAGFDLISSVRGYITFLKTEPGNLKVGRLRHAKLKSDLLELALGEKTGTLVLRAAVEKKLFQIIRQSRDGLLNIPSRCSGVLASQTEQSEVFRILTEEIHAALEGLAMH